MTRQLGVPSSALALAVAASFAYMVLVGGTSIGDTHPMLRLLNAAIGGAFIAVYAARLPSLSDQFDKLILGATALFALAGVLSSLPRQSLDATVTVLALAAVTYCARQMGNDPSSRWAVLTSMRVLSVLLVAATLIRWLPPLVEWWSLAGRSTLPPLDLDFHAHPWGHRHDLTLLVAMLYPSWLTPTPKSFPSKVLAVTMGVATGAIVLMDGSRALWLAFALATVIVLAPSSVRFVRDRHLLRPVLASVAVILAAGIAFGLFGPVIDRFLDFQTVRARGHMWSALFELWGSNPVAGLGPGTFVWDLQHTGYFDTASWAPRHPDSAIFQLLAEAGAIGVAAVALIGGALFPHLLGVTNAPARWALLAFAFACLANNPTDFSFLLITAIAWVGLLAPRSVPAREGKAPTAFTRSVQITLLLVLALTTALSSAATFAYESARLAIDRGHFIEAEQSLTRALRLDPSHALYARQRGTGRLISGNLVGAEADLTRATQLNPSDDLAWRGLAIALREGGDLDRADQALEHALRTQRSDLTNLLISAYWNSMDGETDVARSQLAEAVLAVPGLLTAPDWGSLTAVVRGGVADLAISRWESGAAAPAPIRTQPAELVGWTQRTDLADEAAKTTGLTDELATATIAVFSCAPGSLRLLTEMHSGSRRMPEYWRLVIAASAREGQVDDRAVQILAIMAGNTPGPTSQQRLNPLNENTSEGFSADAWGYERNPITWAHSPLTLPSPVAGQQRWIYGDSDWDSQALLCNEAR